LLLRRAGGCTPGAKQDQTSFCHTYSYIILDSNRVCHSNIHNHFYTAASHGFFNSQSNPDPYLNGNDYQYPDPYSDTHNKHYTDTEQYTLHTTAYLYQHAHSHANLYFSTHTH
jgi:hypothetical protein